MTNDTPVNDGGTCGQSADSADNMRTSEAPCHRTDCAFHDPDFTLNCGGEHFDGVPMFPSCNDRLKPIPVACKCGKQAMGLHEDEWLCYRCYDAAKHLVRRAITAAETMQAIIDDAPTPASYGEPWPESDVSVKLTTWEYERARACVNACQGIADPVEMRRVYDAHVERERKRALFEKALAEGRHSA